MLPIIFVMPLLQLLILAYATTFEIRQIRILLVDADKSTCSHQLIMKYQGSPFYKIVGDSPSYAKAVEALYNRKADQILMIPSGFEKGLKKEGKTKIQIVNDAINGSAAALMNAYTTSIARDYNSELVVSSFLGIQVQPPVTIERSFWYNPELNYQTYMVPGILVILVTLIGLFLSGMNMVREKEIGTIEQINVTPIKKYQFIAGKLFPFWFLAIAELAFGLFLAKLMFNIPIVGNLGLIFGAAAVYLIVMAGIGLVMSTITQTQQQSMFLSWFFMIVFIMMSGLFTPAESMPWWAQYINSINPVMYFIKIMRNVLLKGSEFQDIIQPFLALCTLAVLALAIAINRYRKTT
ncbi:MAG: ABC transporter permease [Lentimicrobiaceae bacterium]|nr:ABC transporter permease [Lentimicrobiaceae bacterium]